jgi:PAS domain S-box-containing protein
VVRRHTGLISLWVRVRCRIEDTLSYSPSHISDARENEILRLRARLEELLAAARGVSPAEESIDRAQTIQGGGEMGELIRQYDWSSTTLGPVTQWPQSLKTSLRTVLHSRYPMFIWWGPELINFYNDAYIPVLGKRHPWALGKAAREVWGEIWDEVGPQVDVVLREGQGTWNDQLLLVMRRYGYVEETYFTFSYSPAFDDAGKIGGVFCACTEATEQVVSERRLRALRQVAAQTANARTAQEACLLSMTALAEQQKEVPFALTYLFEGEQAKLTCATGLPWTSRLAPAIIDVLQPAGPWPVSEALQARSVVLRDLASWQLPGGVWPEPCTTAMVLPLVHGGLDRPLGFMVAGISPRREFDDRYGEFLELLAGGIATTVASARAYEEEKRRSEALAALDRAKTTFFSNISHEFRTPLTLILGPLEELLARAGSLDAGVRGQLELVHRNSHRLLRLVNNLLDFSRLEARRVRASYEPLDLAATTTDIASVFRSAVERAGLRFTIDCPPLSQKVYVDREMWEKIVLNLLSNALKFTLKGGITVSLGIVDGMAELRVADTGIGIPGAELPHLFERFYRVDGAQGRTQEGSGIGLALVQELAKLHGGTVAAESTPGQGSVFSIRIPLGSAHLPADRIDPPGDRGSSLLKAEVYAEEALQWLRPAEVPTIGQRPPELALPLESARGRILLADDNADMREYIVRLLGTRYDVIAVSDGALALAEAIEEPPDLILTDVMMPGLDGFDLLRAIRNHPRLRTTPVILLSARAGQESRVEGLTRGADDYLTKPFTAGELTARVASQLELAKQRREAETQVRRRVEEVENLMEALPAYVWIASDPECRHVTGNQAANELLGAPAGANVSHLSPEGPPIRAFRGDGTLCPTDELPMQRAIAARGPVRDMLLDFVRPDGRRVPTVGNAVPLFDDTGQVRGCVAAFTDITRLREMEQSLRDANQRLNIQIDSSPLAVVEWDGELRITRWAGEAEKVFGWTAAEVTGKTAEELGFIHEDDVDLVARSTEEMRSGARPSHVNRNRNLRKDGALIHCEWYNTSVRDSSGQLVSVLSQVLDVTDRNRAEEALRRRTAELDSLLSNAPIGFAFFDREHRYIRVNDELCDLTGPPAHERLGRRLADVVPGIATSVDPILDRVFATGEAVQREIFGETPKHPGTQRHWLAGFYPVLSDRGTVASVGAFVIDISERKLMEEALRESEDKFRTLADSIPQLAWMTDDKGWIFWYNQRWYDYTGTTLEQVEGSGWRAMHHPDHLDRVAEHYARSIESGEIWEDTFPLRGVDGGYRWFLSRAVPIRDSGGRIVRWFGTNTDITDRLAVENALRETEARFRRLYDANIVGIVSADRERVLDSNDLFLEMVGYSRDDLKAGRVRWDAIGLPEYAPLDERVISELLQTGACRPVEKEYVRKDGTRVPVLIGATLLERTPLQWLCFVVDLSERKTLERRLVEKQKLESIGLLAGGIAHDFNNLLVGILGNASIAHDLVPRGGPASAVLNEIVHAGERAAHLTRQMLAYSGKGRFVIEALDLSNLVVEITRLLRPSISKRIRLDLDLAPDLPPVEADAGQMQQVVMNIVLNAAEAIGPDGGWVAVRTGARAVDRQYIEQKLGISEIEPGNFVWLEVRDTGCGMDKNTMERMFDPFFSTKFTGRGLGLAAVSGIVRGHKGAIQVKSSPGGGTTITVWFPAGEAMEGALPPVAPKAAPRSEAGTVLVIDDEELVLRTAELALRNRGYHVLKAASGTAAIDMLRREREHVSVVVLDLSMPGMSGHEVLPELRQIRPDIPVIVSSGYSEAETMQYFAGQKVSAFIQKPYTAAKLAEQLNAVLSAG